MFKMNKKFFTAVFVIGGAISTITMFGGEANASSCVAGGQEFGDGFQHGNGQTCIDGQWRGPATKHQEPGQSLTPPDDIPHQSDWTYDLSPPNEPWEHEPPCRRGDNGPLGTGCEPSVEIPDKHTRPWFDYKGAGLKVYSQHTVTVPTDPIDPWPPTMPPPGPPVVDPAFGEGMWMPKSVM